MKTDRALALATTFHDAIKDTEYYKRYERTDEPIPRQVMEELAESVCLCGLAERTAERDAVRALLFEPPAEEAREACETRRRAFALLLSLMDHDGAVADRVGEFWRGVINRFLRAPSADSVEHQTVAAWAALAMKECMQDALCSVWTGVLPGWDATAGSRRSERRGPRSPWFESSPRARSHLGGTALRLA